MASQFCHTNDNLARDLSKPTTFVIYTQSPRDICKFSISS